MRMLITRSLGLLLLLGSAISFSLMIYWFYQSAEPRAKQKEMQDSAKLFTEKTRSLKSKKSLGILGLGFAGLSTTGIVTAEAAALHCEKRAWQYCSLALLFGFSGFLLTRIKTQEKIPSES